MRRITPRTCLWPLVACITATFALSLGLTYRSNHHCYAGTCGEWLFPLQARLHVVVWYSWISISIGILALRAFQPRVRTLVSRPLGRLSLFGKQVRVSGILLVLWISILYGILIGIWWVRLRDYFHERGDSLLGNNKVAAVALTGHLADVTMGMVLLPVSRHSALTEFFKLSPSTTYMFHMALAYILLGLVIIHGSLYASWATIYDHNREHFRRVLPVLNPTYLYNEVWPGDTTGLGIWRASLIFTGCLATLIMLAMFLTSFPFIRRKHFNLFYFTHLLAIAVVIVICLHASTMFYCTIPGLSMWLLDWGMRVFELREKLDSHLAPLGNGWYSITLPLPRKRLSGCACHSPLAHFYIHHARSSIREIHPFTTITHLASKKLLAEEGDGLSIRVQFLFKASGNSTQWTSKLGSLVGVELNTSASNLEKAKLPAGSSEWTDVKVDGGSDITVRLEGPYFTPANPELFKTVVCLAAGTGLSGAIAIASAFRAQRSGRIASSMALHDTEALNCSMATTTDGLWQRCIIIWTVRESDYVHIPYFDELACEGLEYRVHKTGKDLPRLDVKSTLMQICPDDGFDSWCYISGPNGFISAAERACGEVTGLTWFAARWD